MVSSLSTFTKPTSIIAVTVGERYLACFLESGFELSVALIFDPQLPTLNRKRPLTYPHHRPRPQPQPGPAKRGRPYHLGETGGECASERELATAQARILPRMVVLEGATVWTIGVGEGELGMWLSASLFPEYRYRYLTPDLHRAAGIAMAVLSVRRHLTTSGMLSNTLSSDFAIQTLRPHGIPKVVVDLGACMESGFGSCS